MYLPSFLLQLDPRCFVRLVMYVLLCGGQRCSPSSSDGMSGSGQELITAHSWCAQQPETGILMYSSDGSTASLIRSDLCKAHLLPLRDFRMLPAPQNQAMLESTYSVDPQPDLCHAIRVHETKSKHDVRRWTLVSYNISFYLCPMSFLLNGVSGCCPSCRSIFYAFYWLGWIQYVSSLRNSSPYPIIKLTEKINIS